jgi:hypothetical protein
LRGRRDALRIALLLGNRFSAQAELMLTEDFLSSEAESR